MAKQGYSHLVLEEANMWALSSVLNATMPVGVVVEEEWLMSHFFIDSVDMVCALLSCGQVTCPRCVLTGSREHGLTIPAYRHEDNNSMYSDYI